MVAFGLIEAFERALPPVTRAIDEGFERLLAEQERTNELLVRLVELQSKPPATRPAGRKT